MGGEREREPQNTAGMGRRRGREVEMEKLCNEEGGEEGRKGRGEGEKAL